nr:hypothetical protein Ade03nite_12070 [Actinoplanes derwentensis]
MDGSAGVAWSEPKVGSGVGSGGRTSGETRSGVSAPKDGPLADRTDVARAGEAYSVEAGDAGAGRGGEADAARAGETDSGRDADAGTDSGSVGEMGCGVGGSGSADGINGVAAAGPGGGGDQAGRVAATRPDSSARPAAARTWAAAWPVRHGSVSPQTGHSVVPSCGPSPPPCASTILVAVRASTLSGFTYVDATGFAPPFPACPRAGTA